MRLKLFGQHHLFPPMPEGETRLTSPESQDGAARVMRIIERHIVVHVMDARTASAIASMPEDEEWATRQAISSRAAARALGAAADEVGLSWRGRISLERIATRLLKWEHERLLRESRARLMGGGLSETVRAAAEDQVRRSRTVLKSLA